MHDGAEKFHGCDFFSFARRFACAELFLKPVSNLLK
jgi:hypothetical protein